MLYETWTHTVIPVFPFPSFPLRTRSDRWCIRGVRFLLKLDGLFCWEWVLGHWKRILRHRDGRAGLSDHSWLVGVGVPDGHGRRMRVGEIRGFKRFAAARKSVLLPLSLLRSDVFAGESFRHGERRRKAFKFTSATRVRDACSRGGSHMLNVRITWRVWEQVYIYTVAGVCS